MAMTYKELKEFVESIKNVATDETEVFGELKCNQDEIFNISISHEYDNPILIDLNPDTISGAIFIKYDYFGNENHAKFEIEMDYERLHNFIDLFITPIFISNNKNVGVTIESVTVFGVDILSAYAIYRELEPYNYNLSMKILKD